MILNQYVLKYPFYTLRYDRAHLIYIIPYDTYQVKFTTYA